MSEHNGKKMTGAQCLITALEDAGVETIFGYPGGQALALYDALYSSEKLTHVLVRHEQAAVHAADGYARATGKAGCVLVTSGPGATNTVTGIATACMDSIPVVIITGQVPTGVLGSDAFQESDMTGVTLPIVKHSYLVKEAAELAPTVAQAFHIASTGRPGPVVIDVPSDLARQDGVVYKYPDVVKLQSYKPTYKGNARQVKQVARALKNAKRPVIYAGGGIISSGATQELTQLSEMLAIPVATTLEGKGAYPETSVLNLGMLGMHGSVAANYALRDADFVFAIGTRFSDRSTGRPEAFAPHARIAHIDIDPAEIGKNRKADIPIVGDAKTVLAAIIDELQKEEAKPVAKAWLSQVQAWMREYPFAYELHENGVQPQRVLETLDGMTKDRDTIFTTEFGQHQMWASQYLHTTRPRSFLSSGGAGTMGFGLPAAMGAQIACPKSRVVCIAGDGSLQMNIQEMATIYGNALPVKVLLLDNNCLGMVHQMQELFLEGRYSETNFFGNPDFAVLARAYGWSAFELDNEQELESTMRKWLDEEGPSLLWVKVSSDEDVFPMIPEGKTVDDAIGITTLDTEEGE